MHGIEALPFLHRAAVALVVHRPTEAWQQLQQGMEWNGMEWNGMERNGMEEKKMWSLIGDTATSLLPLKQVPGDLGQTRLIEEIHRRFAECGLSRFSLLKSYRIE